jgi:ribosomal protein S18 acetylase RimI-like enzyme
MPTDIRAAQLSDAGPVLALWQDSGAEPTHTDDLESLARLIRHDPAALLVALDESRVVGSVIAAWDGWRGSIYRLVVARSHRRRGLASLLLETAEARLDALGAHRLQAIVVETDQLARSFWLATSWQQQSARLRFTKG